jgi:hypothetical protein
MSTTLKNIKIPYPTEGIIRSAQLNDTVTPENSLQVAVNMNFDRVGAWQTRPGIATFGANAGGKVISLGTLNRIDGTRRIFMQSGTTISMWVGSWSAIRSGLSSQNKARFSQFLGYTWMVNGVTGGDTVMTSAGGAFSTTYVPPTLPKGTYIQAGFDGRVWVADAENDAVYFTDQVQFVAPATYSLTFNLATNFIQNFSPQDGETITGLCRVPRALLVFKQNHIYRIYGSFNADAYPAYNVGTFSQESIIQAKDGIYFHHSSGFYKFTYDSQPVEISRRVIDFVKAIPRTYYGDITGVWDGFDAVLWAVGPVTVEGVTYSNCVMRYTISTQVWTIYDYPGVITAMVRYDSGTTIDSYFGFNAGNFGILDSGTTDFGAPIYFESIDRWRSFTEMYAKAKAISGINVYSENGGGTRLEYQTEKSPANVWEYIDTVNSEYDALFPNASTKDFSNVRLRLVGNSSGTPVVFHGIEILSLQDKGFESN